MDDGLTLADYLEQWVALQATQLQPSTWLSYQGNVRRYLAPALGHLRLTELSAAHLNPFYLQLLQAGGYRGKPLALRTVRYCHGVLHKALEDARKIGLVDENVSDKATLPRYDPRQPSGGAREIRAWTAEQLRAFLAHAGDDPLAPLWVLAASTGLRRGEMLGLAWRDVDLDRCVVHVRHALTVVRGHARLKAPKNSRARVVSIDGRTAEALRRRRDAQQAEQRAAGPCWRNEWDLVFTGPAGHPVLPDAVTRAFRALAGAAPVPRIRLHDLRHTHATLLLQAGVPIKVVSERLGHATVMLTMDIYAHVLPAMDTDAVARFEAHVYGDDVLAPRPLP
jgi:integrase